MKKYDGICLPKGFINDVRVRELLISKNLELLVRTSEEYTFVKKYNLKHSMTESTLEEHPLCYCRFIDEPISTPETWKPIYDSDPKTIFGELTKSRLKQLKGFVTYTAYRKLIDVFGWFRIPIPFTNQISMWEWMQKEFGDRFNICWINMPMNEGDEEVLELFADTYGKEKWLYIEEKTTVDEFLNKVSK